MSRITFTVFAALALAATGYPGSITTSLNPHNPPIRIPGTGGSFDYDVQVTDTDSVPVALDVWTELIPPGGGMTVPVYGPADLVLWPGWFGNTDQRACPVAESLPDGGYWYAAYAGIWPDSVVAGDSFEFVKEPAANGWFVQNSGTDAYLTGVWFPTPDTGWAVGAVKTILRTTDAGLDWYPQTAPNFSLFYDVQFLTGTEGWVVGSGGIVEHTADAGETWSRLTIGAPDANELHGVWFTDPLHGVVVGGKPWTTSPSYRSIIRTTDGGANWTSELYESYYNPLEAVFFSDADHGWAVGGSAVFATSDGGANWTEQTHPGGGIHHVFFTDNDNGWLVGSGGVVLRTTDGGSNWTEQNPGTTDDLEGMFFIGPDTGWAVGGNGVENATVIHTTDRGASWSGQDPATGNYLRDVFFVDGDRGWAVGAYGTIIHTVSGGRVQVGLEERDDGRAVEAPGLRVRSSNPFKRSVDIDYTLPRAGHVRLAVYDATGRLVRELAVGNRTAGSHRAALDARELPAGVYALRLDTNGASATRELILAR